MTAVHPASDPIPRVIMLVDQVPAPPLAKQGPLVGRDDVQLRSHRGQRQADTGQAGRFAEVKRVRAHHMVKGESIGQ